MALEKQGMLVLLSFLGRNGSALRDVFKPPMLRMTQEALDLALATMLRCNLVLEKKSDVLPGKMIIEITPRGKAVADHLLEIEKLLSGKTVVPEEEKLAQISVSLEDLPGYVSSGPDKAYEEKMKKIIDDASKKTRERFEEAKRKIRRLGSDDSLKDH